MTATVLQLLPSPELFIGLVAPIGVDLDIVSAALSSALSELGYHTREFRITRLMREIPTGMTIASAPFIESYRDRIAYANKVRSLLGDDALASLAVTAIRAFRRQINSEADAKSGLPDRDQYRPLAAHAYILRQFKRPEEILLLRRVYGRQFIVISAYAPPEVRKKVIAERQRHATRSRTSKVEAENQANALVAQDSRETRDTHGQNVRDAFPLADVIVDATSRDVCTSQIKRFVQLLFGNNRISPTHAEYGMYLAKSASLRTLDLSRQVGAAIFSDSGEILALGSNEVPKSGGGTYWAGDNDDARDHVRGHDPNDHKQVEILVDLLDCLRSNGHLSVELASMDGPNAIADHLLNDETERSVADSMVMDLLEFGRIIHAEMSALSDAARNGTGVKHGTLYCTTFPCHMCAKHIVAAGLHKVVYLEPYQKSYASELHSDAIIVDGEQDGLVSFQTFIGVSPFRYRDLFERRRKRKTKDGSFQEWQEGDPRPNVELYQPGYREAEEQVSASFELELQRVDQAGSRDAPGAPRA